MSNPNQVVVSQVSDVTTVELTTRGPQGPSLPDGDKGDVTVSSNGTAISINNNAVTSAKILNGTIVDADINASATIALSKLATGALPTAITVTSANISDLSIVDADISSSAAISLSKLATGALPTAITVTSANISDLSIVNADINASANISGTKINPNFGSQTIVSSLDGNQVTQGNAALTLTHATNSNLRANHFVVDDFPSGGGTYFIQTTESGVSNDRNMCLQGYGGKLKIGSNSVAPTELLDVAGNIAVSGTVDGRDLATDGTKLDGIETGATADQTASEILSLLSNQNIPTTGQFQATGSGNSSGLIIANAHESFRQFFVNNNADSDFYLSYIGSGGADIIFKSNGEVQLAHGGSNKIKTQSSGVAVTGSISLTGTVDGVDIAARNTLFGGLTSSSGVLTDGVTATTQSASDNSTKVATTAYTDTAISNLVNSAPSTLDTLKELSDALGSDPNFATTVTNSIATKLPLAGGTLTGNLTLSNTAPELLFNDTNANSDYSILIQHGSFHVRDTTNSLNRFKIQSDGTTTVFNNLDVGAGIDVTGNITVSGTVDGRDLSVDGTKLDGIESNATADQTASEIKTLFNSSGLVNAQIDASAAIAGTKISPDFGSQNIVTTGTVDAVGITIGGNTPSLNFNDANDNPDFRFLVNSNSFILEDTTNSANRFVVNSDGHIDITGNLNVGAGLDVTGGSNSFTSTGDTVVKVTSANGSTAVLDLGDAADTDAGRITYDSANNMEFSTNSSPRVRINSDGEVGIGNSNPTSQLHVTRADSTAYDATDDAAQRSIGSTIMVENGNGTTDSFAQIAFDLADTNQSIARIVAINTGTGSSDLAFVTEHSNAKAERLRIKSNGNVGIGTNNPNDELEIASNHSQLRLTDTDDSKFVQFSYSGGKLITRNNSTNTSVNQFTLDELGRLGIGTQSPARPLDVNGSMRLSNDSVVEWGGTTTSIAGSSSSNTLFFTIAGGEKARLNDTGLGIGETNPDTILHIKTSNPDIHIENTGTGTGQLRVGHFTNGAFIGTYNDDGGGSDNLRLGTSSGQARLIIASNGDMTATNPTIGTISDVRLKKDIVDFEYNLETFKLLKPKTFNWINPNQHNNQENNIGFIAQELENIDVNLTGLHQLEDNDAEISLIDNDKKVKTSKLSEKDAIYVSVINQLINRIEALENA